GRARAAGEPVVDLGIGDIHLGALGHDIVVAYDRHPRFPRAATSRFIDSRGAGAVLAPWCPAQGGPHGPGSGVKPAVDHIGRYFNGLTGSLCSIGIGLSVIKQLIAYSYLAHA